MSRNLLDMESQDISNLILKHLYQTITDSEKQELNKWINASEVHRQRFNVLTNSNQLKEKLAVWKSAGNDPEKSWEILQEKLQAPELVPVRVRVRMIRSYWQVAAAIIVIVFAATVYIKLSNNSMVRTVPGEKATAHNDVKPGSDKAVLTLANGKVITLDDVVNGVVAKQGSAEISKNGGLISYNATAANTQQALFNMLTIPKGGQYRLLLNDGTKVWLNSSSSIKFPVAFSGNERKVEITGEAYFEVAHDASKPFYVSKGDMSVQALGTHFNVNAYDDEDVLRVTLLEGSVEVKMKNEKLKIKPGQQAVVASPGALLRQANIKAPGRKDGEGDDLHINNSPDLEQVMAWKNGMFIFKNSSLQEIMREASRWYDIQVIYQGTISNERYKGDVPRNTNLSELMKVLALSGVKYKIEGKQIAISQ